MTTRTVTGRTIWGLILVALGTLFLLDQLDVAQTGDIIGTWWPMILIVLGGWGLATSAGRNLGALILLMVGVTLQVDQLEIFETSAWEVAWPIGLIVIGLWLLVRKPWHGAGGIEIFVPAGWDVDLHGTPLLGGVDDKRRRMSGDGDGPRPKLRVDATAIMGGVELKDA